MDSLPSFAIAFFLCGRALASQLYDFSPFLCEMDISENTSFIQVNLE